MGAFLAIVEALHAAWGRRWANGGLTTGRWQMITKDEANREGINGKSSTNRR